MELDELKNLWQQQPQAQPNPADRMKQIYDPGKGPVAAHKRSFKKQMRLMIIVPALLFATYARDASQVLTSILFWGYVLFCLYIIVFSYVNYRLVRSMESPDARVKTNLESQVQLLEKRLRWRTTGLRIALLFLISLVEITPYIQHNRMLDKWHALHPAVRFGSYALLLLVQHFVSRKVNFKRYGHHLQHLNELVRQLEG